MLCPKYFLSFVNKKTRDNNDKLAPLFAQNI